MAGRLRSVSYQHSAGVCGSRRLTARVGATETSIQHIISQQYRWQSGLASQNSCRVLRLQDRKRLSSQNYKGTASRRVTCMGNKSTGGPFAPLVVVIRNYMGVKQFNQLRGKAIALHSQVIKEFGAQIGAETKQVQGLIRLAKKNGEMLGFLA